MSTYIDLLIEFLNQVFRGRKQIVDLVYNKNEHPGDNSENGGAIFDLTCTGSGGEKILIEIQRSSQFHLKKRMLYYASKLIADQAPKGKRAAWNYNITEVYVIVLMDGFTMPGAHQQSHYLHNICLSNRDTGEVFYEELGFFYIELLNFVKNESDLETDLDRWLYVLKHMSKLEKLPVFLRKPVFQKLFEVAEYSNLTKEEQVMYDVALKRKWDNASVLESAKAEGLAAGKAEGLVAGRAEGKVEGKAEGKAEVVKNLLVKLGFTDEQAADVAGVSVEFVANVRASISKKK